MSREKSSESNRLHMMAARVLLAAAALLALFALPSRAQFKEEAFSQQYDSADTLGRDTSGRIFSVKQYLTMVRTHTGGDAGKLAMGSAIMLGGQQMYNNQKWKLPIIYGGLAATAGAGIYFNSKYKSTQDERFRDISTWCFVGTGLVYWGMLLDGTVNFKPDKPHDAGKATTYAVLLPGLGQAYNGEYWKIPIYFGLTAGAAHFVVLNNKNYQRYKWIHNQATTEDSGYDGPVSAETALYYRDIFRRYRDYSIVALIASYLLQIIDANVFSYMQDFELDDDITLRLAPQVLPPDNVFARLDTPSATSPRTGPGFGLSLSMSF